MDGKGDINIAKELRDSFSRPQQRSQQRSQQRPNRKNRMQQAAGKSHSTNAEQQQGGRARPSGGSNPGAGALRSIPRGDHSFQFGRGLGTVPSRSRPMPTPSQKKGEVRASSNLQYPQGTVSSPQAPPTTTFYCANILPPTTQQQPGIQPILQSRQAFPPRQLAHVVAPDPRAVLQDPLVDVTNHRSPPKRVATHVEQDKDMKLTNSQSSQETDTDDVFDLGDLMSFDDSPPLRQTANDATANAMPSFASVPLNPLPSNRSQATNEDVLMKGMQTSSTGNRRKHRRGLSGSMWYSEDGQQIAPIDSASEIESQLETTTRSPDRIVESGMSRGQGLGGSRWAD